MRRKASLAFLNASHRKKFENHWCTSFNVFLLNFICAQDLLFSTKLCEHKNALQRLLALITWFTKHNCVNVNLHRNDFLRSEFACLKKIM